MLKIALVSLDQKWEEKPANRTACENFIQKASALACDLVCFPEMTLTGFTMNTGYSQEDADQSESLDFFRTLARTHHIGILFGMIETNHEKPFNSAILLEPTGEIVGTYHKMHPFSFAGEDRYFSYGSEPGLVRLKDTLAGLSICYDLRFPELFQAMSKKCSLIFNIASWPEKRVDHWNTLLKARAIENQVFFIGLNRTGTDGNGLNYVKSSAVFDPTGARVEPFHSDSMEFDVFLIDPEVVQQVRAGFPVKNDRRTDLYKSIL